MSKQTVMWALKGSATLGLLAFIASRFDLGAALARLAAADPGLMAAAVGVLLVSSYGSALRWALIARSLGHGLPQGQAFSWFLQGLFFNIALPGAVGGDAFRIWKSSAAGLGLGPAAAAVFLDRVIVVLALALVSTMAMIHRLDLFRGQDVTWILPLLLAASLGGIVTLLALDLIPAGWRHFRAVAALAGMSAHARRLFLRPSHAAGALVLAVVAQMAVVAAVKLIALALGIAVDMSNLLALVPPVVLLSSLPISISGWGVREAAMVAALSLCAVEAGSAFSLSVGLGLLSIVCGLPGGLIWLADKGGAKAPKTP